MDETKDKLELTENEKEEEKESYFNETNENTTDLIVEKEKRKPHTRSRKRLLLPFERSQNQKTESSPKKRKKTYRKISNQSKRTIAYAKSIMESIHAVNSRMVIQDLEDDIFINTDLIDENKTDDQLLESAYTTHFNKNQKPSLIQIPSSSTYQVIDSQTWSIPEESILPILSGESPLPVPKQNIEAFQAIQGQLDEYIVDRLPKEFWGSQFYMPSTIQLTTPSLVSNKTLYSSKQKKKDKKMIEYLTSIANKQDMNLLRFYNRRFSRTRTTCYLDRLCEKYQAFVDEGVLEKARERMDELSQDLYTRASYQKKNALFNFYICLHMKQFVLFLLLIIVFSHDITSGDHLHVSMQFQHKKYRTKWLSFPLTQLPYFLQDSTSRISYALSEMEFNSLEAIRVCFELTDVNRQTTWITIADGRGIYAETVNLIIHVKENNIAWIDVQVDYYKKVFYSGMQTPQEFAVHFIWKNENSFNSNRGYHVFMWVSMINLSVIVLSIIWNSMNQTAEEIRKQQFKQPVKSSKAD